MSEFVSILLADASDTLSRTSYEWSRLRQVDDGRLLILIVLSIAALALAWVTYVYRRDTGEINRGVRLLLLGLRYAAFIGLLFFFFGLERRDQTQVVYNSHVAVMIDASQSMGLRDTATAEKSRLDRVKQALRDSPLLRRLTRIHDVRVLQFADQLKQIAVLPKVTGAVTGEDVGAETASPTSQAISSQLDALLPQGRATRLGDSLIEELKSSQDSPLAGIILFSDGVNNTGIEPKTAIDLAKDAEVPIYTVGLGSTAPQRNVAIRDFSVPARSFPGDSLSVVGYLQSRGYASRGVEVELYVRRAEEPSAAAVQVASERIPLGPDGEIVAATFELQADDTGRFVYELRVIPPGDDSNSRDNVARAEIDIADRRTQVLLFAGGPSRDYSFLRTQLFRDRTMEVDVLLQTAAGSVSQDARRILDAFPSKPSELYDYDVIVAFDPDWTQLNAEQVSLLEKWVAEEAGGMIAVAGPVNMAKWTRSTELGKLRALYPVEFQRRLTLLDDGHHGGRVPWPMEFEPAGIDADFLWLGKNRVESEQIWSEFPGVFGYYAVNEAKPGATVYAYFSDPAAVTGSQRPIYFAEQFYGAGRVFYMASGELWRLRSIDPKHFETLTTKLIRHVAQGRLLRGSARGALLADRDRYQIGDVVVLRARLTDAQFAPLAVPNVTAQVVLPDQTAESVPLAADPAQPGIFVGQFIAAQDGSYQISLSIPDGAGEVLNRQVQVSMPDLERGDLQRNEVLLATLAEQTGGRYYSDLNTAVEGRVDAPSPAELIPSREEVKPFDDVADEDFTRRQMHWLLAVVCGALFMEWSLRRWFYLA